MSKVLIAEDEKILRDLMVSELEQNGFSVFAAEDGLKAWDLIDKEEPEVLLLDLLMPTMNGYELMYKVRSDSRFRITPILVLSNSGHVEDINRAYQCGANDVLIKANFIPMQLTEKVQKLLKKVSRN